MIIALLGVTSPTEPFQTLRQEQWLLIQYKTDLGLNATQLQAEMDKLDQLSPDQLNTLVNDYKQAKLKATKTPGPYNYRVYLRNDLYNQPVNFPIYSQNYFPYYWPIYSFYIPNLNRGYYHPYSGYRPYYHPTYHPYHPHPPTYHHR